MDSNDTHRSDVAPYLQWGCLESVGVVLLGELRDHVSHVERCPFIVASQPRAMRTPHPCRHTGKHGVVGSVAGVGAVHGCWPHTADERSNLLRGGSTG